MVEEMYHVMAIANYEDRFVIPTSHREETEDAYDIRGGCGFSFGNGCSGGTIERGPVRRAQAQAHTNADGGVLMRATLKILAALLTYPTAELVAAVPEMRAALDAEGLLSARQRSRLDRLLEELVHPRPL